jgi:feruloyl esterase
MNNGLVWCVGLAVLRSLGLRGEPCSDLSKVSSERVTIQFASVVKSGDFSTTDGEPKLSDLPAFCRVIATLKPTADSKIGIEVWLPVESWNGKFLAVGSGGWGGSIAYGGMADALKRGYVTSATDDGHTGPSADFIVGHPEKFVDFAYRAEHEMTVEAKALIAAFYKRAARYSYWNGCSGGGREGLLQAYRYPDEFNGIIAGDPADMRRNAWALWLANHSFKDREDYIPPAKYPMIHEAVLRACDAQDGLKDGLIQNPEACHFELKELLCKGGDQATCLTAKQVRTAQTMISAPRNANGNVLFPRLEPGTELAWARLAGGPKPADLFLDQFRYVVYRDPNWDWRTFELDRDAAKAAATNHNVDELNPDLTSFAKQGGKLLIYHGWADQQVAPGASIEFYSAATRLSNRSMPRAEWIRLYMVPGMGHCSGGEGPNSFEKISVLEKWVEQGIAPGPIVASHKSAGRIDRTMPLCPYPQLARYSGTGNRNDAANFACWPSNFSTSTAEAKQNMSH